MGSFIGFAEVTGAILGALGLALGLEWFSLNGLTRLMAHSMTHSADPKGEPRHAGAGANKPAKNGSFTAVLR